MQHAKGILDINELRTADGSTIRYYNQVSNIYYASGNVTLVDNCVGYMFTNVGDANATVNGMRIFPSATPTTALGDSRSIAAHSGDIYKGNIILQITPGTALPGVEIVQIFYVKDYKPTF